MQSHGRKKDSPRAEIVAEVLEMLAQTAAQSVAYLEHWQHETADLEIKVGLEAQLIDERRHHRLLKQELALLPRRQRGANQPSPARLFNEIATLDSDLHRICAFHRGVKAFTVNRCGHLVPLVEPRLATVLDQIAREEERQIRWADIRLARLLTHAEMRSCNLLMSRVASVLDGIWDKTWRELVRSKETRDPGAAAQ